MLGLGFGVEFLIIRRCLSWISIVDLAPESRLSLGPPILELLSNVKFWLRIWHWNRDQSPWPIWDPTLTLIWGSTLILDLGTDTNTWLRIRFWHSIWNLTPTLDLRFEIRLRIRPCCLIRDQVPTFDMRLDTKLGHDRLSVLVLQSKIIFLNVFSTL